MKFNKWINGLISAILFFLAGIVVRLLAEGSFKFNDSEDLSTVIGLAIGGFISWAFIIPVLKKSGPKNKD
jgi:Na+/H+ antiporter NhaA